LAAEEQPATPATSDTNRNLLTILFVVYIVGLTVFCVIFHSTLFAWPTGIVTGNLLASAIWAPLAVVHLDRLARKHHRAHIALMKKHHKELMDRDSSSS
jgi:predicted ferric reductase